MPDATGPVRFGSGPSFTVGVEEELLLVDPHDHRLAHTGVEVLERVEVPGGRGRVLPDTYAAEIELVTPVCGDAEEAAGCLRDLRAAVRRAGGTLLGAGIHPGGLFGDVVHHPDPRYAAIHEMVRGLLARTPTCALHVHVGMPDAETAVRVLNGLRGDLPVLQALAANSPFWHGRDSGLASARAQLFRAYPRAELPRAFASFDDWASSVAEVCAQGAAPDYTFLWWDVRLHPRLGTVEVRAMDAQASLGAVAGLAALVHGLARHHADAPAPARHAPRELLTELSFLGARDGVRASFVAGAVDDAVARARAGGGGAALDEVGRIVREGGGAGRQRAAHEQGGMPALLSELVSSGLR